MSPSVSPGVRRSAALVALAAILAGCASAGHPKDPFEPFNRAMFTFNDKVDQVALKPAATVYKGVLPSFVRTGVGNFFGNLQDGWSAVNNFLQGKGAAGLSDVTRVAVNSTLGFGGLLDIASEAGLRKHKEDFGQTLGYWGVASGPYVMLPLLGPSTLRDTATLPIDISADPWAHKDPTRWRNVGTAVRTVDERAALLDASNLMEEAALDRYEFVRDGYLQRRDSQVFDGEGPRAHKQPGGAAREDDPYDPGVTDVTPAETARSVSSAAAPKELTSATVAAGQSGSQSGK